MFTAAGAGRHRQHSRRDAGGVLLGLAETFAAAYISSQIQGHRGFALLVLILLFRPTGLLGKPEVEKVDDPTKSSQECHDRRGHDRRHRDADLRPAAGAPGRAHPMEPRWDLVALACALVFAFQLLRPWISKPFKALKTGLPTLPSTPARGHKWLVVLLIAVAVIWPFFSGRSSVDIATLVLIYVMLGLGLNIVVGFAGLLDLGFVGFYAVGAYTYAFALPLGRLELLGSAAVLGARSRRCSASCWAFRCCACAATTWPSSRWALAKSSACCSST